MKKIMLVRLSSLGDVIFNIPLANVLQRNGFEVTWLVSEKGIDVVKNNPAVKKHSAPVGIFCTEFYIV